MSVTVRITGFRGNGVDRLRDIRRLDKYLGLREAKDRLTGQPMRFHDWRDLKEYVKALEDDFDLKIVGEIQTLAYSSFAHIPSYAIDPYMGPQLYGMEALASKEQELSELQKTYPRAML